jgi:hypothetical protein
VGGGLVSEQAVNSSRYLRSRCGAILRSELEFYKPPGANGKGRNPCGLYLYELLVAEIAG